MERCRRTRQRRRHRRPAILLPLLRRRRGRLERSHQQLGPLMTAGRGRSARGVCDFTPEREYRCGDCHLGRAPFRGARRPARVWHIRGAGGDIETRDQREVQRLGRAGIRPFCPPGGHQNSPFRGYEYMIPYMVGKLAPNSSHLTRGLVKYVPGRGYFRAVSYQNGDEFVTSPPSPIVELVQHYLGQVGVFLEE